MIVRNEKVMRRAGLERIEDMATRRKIRFAGHVLRSPRERPASTAMEWTPKGKTTTWTTQTYLKEYIPQ